MRPGVTALLLGGWVAAAAAAATLADRAAVPLLRGIDPMAREGVAVALHIGVAALAIAPLVWLMRRELDRLSAHFQQVAETGKQEPYRAPGWMRTLGESLLNVSEKWSERCEQLKTRLREVEIRLRVAEAERAHYEAILHSMHDAVIVTDSFNELTIANEHAAKLLGFDVNEAAHRPIDEVIRDERLPSLIKSVISAGVVNKEKHVEHVIEAPDHGRASYDVTLACLPDAQSGVGGVVTILRDVTREKEISQLKSDFVSKASHELRTPLSSINAYVEMLLDSEAQDEASRQEFYQVIKSELDRVNRLIDNMLNISRIEAGIHSVERTEVDFVQVCNAVVETMMPQAAQKNIKLSVKSGPLVYTAQADRDMMHQVVMNLVSNGIKYTPEGGRVTITVENDDASRSVMVTVADTGLGIPPDALNKVFDKFYRIESYKRVAKGTGLGLNLVKHIVETVHHGRITVTSEVGMGSRFCFTIPYEYEGGV